MLQNTQTQTKLMYGLAAGLGMFVLLTLPLTSTEVRANPTEDTFAPAYLSQAFSRVANELSRLW